ncbi:RNA polymerase subunit sigma [Flavobacterium sp. 9AF]|uniref:RNA polymerase sigma factor n=1 Tax=Flavobacterium sp. 9AF TaxID=2653142 RepID=UPI0012EF247B|nr:sigma-70 family RNA polymerase sigma factor [Flavobacterium sp. 9AF]VXB91906.1 RNA polymerase subunit sigma [Flavobacterium sp. 9AF]
MENSNRYINALINGDNTIISEIYSKIYPKILKFIINNKGEEDDALDIFHDALMYIIVTQKEKRTLIQSFEAYIFVICKNIWKKKLKNKVIKTEVLTLEERDTNLGELILEQQCFEFYIAKFNLLSQNCKDILSSYFNGISYEEITLNNEYATINTVRQRVFKCRTKLVELIKEDKEFQRIIKWSK